MADDAPDTPTAPDAAPLDAPVVGVAGTESDQPHAPTDAEAADLGRPADSADALAEIEQAPSPVVDHANPATPLRRSAPVQS